VCCFFKKKVTKSVPSWRSSIPEHASSIMLTVWLTRGTSSWPVSVKRTYIEWLKSVPFGQNSISRQPIEFFSPKFQRLQGKEFSTVSENFTAVFSLLQELQPLQYSIPCFKITPKKWTASCNVQCSTSLNSLSESVHVRNVYPSFHTSSTSFCEVQYGLVDWVLRQLGPVLTARVSSVHQCSLAWDEMSCSVQAYLPRRDNQEG